MNAALGGAMIKGVKTNIPFLQRIFASDDFAAGRIHTRYVDERLHEIMSGRNPSLIRFMLTIRLPYVFDQESFWELVSVKSKPAALLILVVALGLLLPEQVLAAFNVPAGFADRPVVSGVRLRPRLIGCQAVSC